MARNAAGERPLIENVKQLEDVKRQVEAGGSPVLSLEDKKRLYVTANALTTVYFIAAVDAGVIKIGRTNNIDKRLATLRTFSPVELKLVCTVNYDDGLEKRIHQHLKEYRSHGEWFYADKPVLDFIRGYQQHGIVWVVERVGDASPYWMNGRGVGVADALSFYMGDWAYRVRDEIDPDYAPNTQNYS